MRIAFAAAVCLPVCLLLRAGPAAADLYRWIDPESGSIKYSSYPPPWYGDPVAERRAPKVEVIPARETTAKPGPVDKAKEGSRAMDSMEAQRKAMLQQLSVLAAQGGDGGPALKAAMNGPKFLAFDKDGSVLIADTENHQIRRYVPGQETMELVAGTGKKGNHFDADPKKLELSRPHGASVHPKTGDLYIADSDNGRVLKIVKD